MTGIIVECAERGDAIFVVGRGEDIREMKVDTHILKSVSEAFRVFFGDQWSDGKNLSYDEPKRILLPEDDPEAMEIICKILHHKHRANQQALNAELVLKLARLVDKYFLQEAMAFASDSLLQATLKDEPQILMDLFRAAFLFNNEGFKTVLSRDLVLKTSGDFSSLVRPDAPQKLLDLLEPMSVTRQKLHDEFHLFLFDIFTYVPRTESRPCECVTAYSTALHKWLEVYGLTWSAQIASLKVVFQRMAWIKQCPEPGKSEYRHTGNQSHKPNTITPSDVHKCVLQRLEEVSRFATEIRIPEVA